MSTFSTAIKTDISLDGIAKEKVSKITRWVTAECDATIPRRRLLPSRSPSYWWNNEITNLRAVCFQGRRLYQRVRRNPGSDDREETHSKLHRRLRGPIRKSKKNFSNQLTGHDDINPRGGTYKMVMKRLQLSAPPEREREKWRVFWVVRICYCDVHKRIFRWPQISRWSCEGRWR